VEAAYETIDDEDQEAINAAKLIEAANARLNQSTSAI